jgi:hypothetical protein
MKVEKEIPEWKQTADLQVKIRKICWAILPARNCGKIFQIDSKVFDSSTQVCDILIPLEETHF